MYERRSKYTPSSQFASYILAFVAEKQGMGNKYIAEAEELGRFDQFVINQGFVDTVVTKEIFESWAAKRNYESVKTHHSRFRTVQQLCKYMARVGLDSYVSPLKLKDNKSAFKPYIFTDIELERFMKCAYELRGREKNRLVFPMLFELLICTGIRLGEC